MSHLTSSLLLNATDLNACLFVVKFCFVICEAVLEQRPCSMAFVTEEWNCSLG